METKTLLRSVGARVAAGAMLMTAFLGAGSPARAAEIRVLSAAAMQSVFKEVIGDFERASAHKVILAYGTIGGISQRIMTGETADLVIGSTQSLPGLVQAGKIRADSQMVICKVGIGMVVPTGTPVPRIVSTEDFKRALLAAKVLVYSDPVRGGAAGVHVGRVLQNLGIAEQLRSQITLGAGGDVTEVTLAQGQGALGMTQFSEIFGKPGAEFVGPLPDELQNYTTFVAAIPTGAEESEAVTAFLQFLRSPSAISAMKAKGMLVD